MCVELDRFDFVMKLRCGETGLGHMEKVE